jgi:SAM-dependent methyltransferase
MNPKTCKSFLFCPEERTLVLMKAGYPIQECKKCGHRFTEVQEAAIHLQEVYSDDYFYGGKQGYPNYLDEKDNLFKAGQKYAKIIAKYAQPGEVLDVGCAAGFILKGFEKAGWHCHGIEPNDTMASYGRNELNLDIQTGSLETFKPNQKFDLINLIQVIGHLYDFDKALINVADLLNPGGLVLVESWNMKSSIARLMGKDWHEYSPPSVVHWFSDKTLAQAFSYYGFMLLKKGRPSKKININHGLSLIDESFPEFIFKKTLLKIFSQVVGKFNIPYPPIDLKWYLFKKL